MSVVKDYLKIVQNGLRNGDKIIEALFVASQEKNGILDAEAVAEILKRKEICAACPFNSRIAKVEHAYESNIPFEHCTLCECRIGYNDSKEYCLTCNCGITVLNERNKQNGLPELPLKWKAFEKTSNNE